MWKEKGVSGQICQWHYMDNAKSFRTSVKKQEKRTAESKEINDKSSYLIMQCVSNWIKGKKMCWQLDKQICWNIWESVFPSRNLFKWFFNVHIMYGVSFLLYTSLRFTLPFWTADGANLFHCIFLNGQHFSSWVLLLNEWPFSNIQIKRRST